MPHVIVQPKGVELALKQGETVFDGARRLGYSWPTVCGGQGTCSTCYMSVADGSENLSEPSAYEREGLERLDIPEGPNPVRLACQAKVFGDVTVTKRGVRKVEAVKEEQWAQR